MKEQKMKKIIGGFLTAILALALVLGTVPSPVGAQQQQTSLYNSLSRFANSFPAVNYGKWSAKVLSGSFSAGTYALTISGPGFVTTPSGTPFIPFYVGTPILVGVGGVQETVTPTAVSGCALVAAPQAVCTITAAFSFAHGPGTVITSGTNGLQEAINFAQGAGGGTVLIDPTWWTSGGTQAILSAAIPYASVAIADSYTGSNWFPAASTSTIIGVPATLTATTVGFALNGANATGGAFTGTSTYHVTYACLDVLGHESQPAADFSGLTAGTSATTYQIGIAAPAQPTGGGCVGWVPYISLAGGSYALAYRVPVATYTNGVAASNGVCTLTTIEKMTAACAITNTTYGQVGSNAIVSALTVNTARIWVGVGGTSTTADVVGNSDARQTYAYIPGIDPGLGATVETHLAFSAATGPATTAPAVVATIHLKPAAMNYVGKTIKVCGNLTSQGGSTATVDQVEFYWDADGSNATGAGVIIPGAKITNTLSATPALRFCQNLTTTVAGSGATAGTILASEGDLGETMSVAATTAANFFTVPNIVVAGSTVAALNLAQEARVDVAVLHTTGTDGTWTANSITITPLN
jgi:hypothetical protein